MACWYASEAHNLAPAGSIPVVASRTRGSSALGYLHIENLYRSQEVLAYKEAYCLEKIHGTSAHIAWDGELRFFSGGNKHDPFVALFDQAKLRAGFVTIGQPSVVVFGEGYGGKCQGMSARYGKDPRFVAFDVKVGDLWLAVPEAEKIVLSLGLEFVHYVRCEATVARFDMERDAPSEQARRNGVEGNQPREGVVIRPLTEVRKNNGERVIAKHKRDDERETRTPRPVTDPEKWKVLANAKEIAREWVTPLRLEHVLDKMPGATGVEQTGAVIAAMHEDIFREGSGEVVDSSEARAEIGRATALLFKAKLKSALETAP